jgi:hypothetical protein
MYKGLEKQKCVTKSRAQSEPTVGGILLTFTMHSLTQSTNFFNVETNLRIIFWSAVFVSSTLKIRQLSINSYHGKDKIKSIYKMNDDEI